MQKIFVNLQIKCLNKFKPVECNYKISKHLNKNNKSFISILNNKVKQILRFFISSQPFDGFFKLDRINLFLGFFVFWWSNQSHYFIIV